MADPSPLRAARAAVFTAVCVGISGAGHAVTSGHGIPAGGLLAAALPVFGLAYAGTARERGFGTVAAWLGWIQLALHTLFALAQAPGGHHGAAPTANGLPAGSADLAAGAGSAVLTGGVPMLMAHVAATAVAAWWIRRGEAAAFALARYARALFDRAIPQVVPDPPILPVRAVRVPDTAARALYPAPLLYSVRRRGPPVGSPTGSSAPPRVTLRSERRCARPHGEPVGTTFPVQGQRRHDLRFTTSRSRRLA
ncbi:hypothetical protein [Nocardiopsis suaedae]|uniref:MFS transporter n=1 Tax=Nocardiopsis suaedae TaxID=3018444 RepID=A0ABT4TFP4_9ACTN|nr:hypothetical protein [Nocardiopsis suaedae]MDA2803527.1 hypothetical protein [Nocardiopsis suaedae]